MLENLNLRFFFTFCSDILATNFIKDRGNVFTLHRIMSYYAMEMTKKYVSMENKTLKEPPKRVDGVDKFLR